MPAARHSSMAYWMSGRSTTVRISLGIALVAGRPPVRAEAAIEIGFQHLEGVRIARAFTVQVEQLCIGQPVECAANEAPLQHRPADIAGRVVDPGFEERRARLGALGCTGRAEAGRRT